MNALPMHKVSILFEFRSFYATTWRKDLRSVSHLLKPKPFKINTIKYMTYPHILHQFKFAPLLDYLKIYLG